MKCNEIKVQVVRESQNEYCCRTPQTVADFWKSEVEASSWYQDEKEMFVVILLSAKNHIKGFNLVSLGLIDQSLVAPRETFRPAIVAGALAVVLAHNHPSGDTAPSSSDLSITKKLVDAGNIIGIKVTDHVIIGDGFYSMREAGLVSFN